MVWMVVRVCFLCERESETVPMLEPDPSQSHVTLFFSSATHIAASFTNSRKKLRWGYSNTLLISIREKINY